MKTSAWGFLVLLGLTAGCGDSTGDGNVTRPPGQLNFILLSRAAPALCDSSVSFWAVKNGPTDAEGALEFPEDGVNCGGSREDFVRLKIKKESLLLYPDGTPFQNLDSVLVTLTWVGSDTIMFHLEPTGLVFDPAHPAELTIEYDHTNGDLDDDGDVDPDDARIEQIMGLWRQPTLADPFTRIGSVKFEDLDEIEAKLNGFSRYAIAY
ncbi:MAG TPA: hypothetical protein VNJ71_12330 [Gemmatimonadales bacterium]|jgi:hypothetical protein|nr:hypothetical protein [Gemmatimonadales bacterium]